jgi:rhamnogalacturonyl hydrolase YesR
LTAFATVFDGLLKAIATGEGSSSSTKHGQQSWSTIIKNMVTNHEKHGQQSSKHMVNNHQKTLSNIVKQRGQQSSKQCQTSSTHTSIKTQGFALVIYK